jgi:hypothetical protein
MSPHKHEALQTWRETAATASFILTSVLKTKKSRKIFIEVTDFNVFLLFGHQNNLKKNFANKIKS